MNLTLHYVAFSVWISSQQLVLHNLLADLGKIEIVASIIIILSYNIEFTYMHHCVVDCTASPSIFQ